MYLLYSLLLTLGFVILLPKFAIDAFRSGKYVTGLRERLGNLNYQNQKDEPLIWLHCVSVGETQAAQSLVRALARSFPRHRLAISTTTVTGQQVARKIFGRDAALIFYFPIDFGWVMRRVLRKLKPSAILIMETELWPRLFKECHARNIPVALLNGRISEKSFGRYQKIRPFMSRVLADLTVALMQSDRDAERIHALGLPLDRISVSGNLKFDSAETAIDERLISDIRERFGVSGSRPLIVAASTHAPEERILIATFKELREMGPFKAQMLIAPRHPDRFDEVASLLENSGLQWARKSRARRTVDYGCDVILLDTIGELHQIYQLAYLVFVGGSISPNGGHNVLEPAAAGCCIITGAHTENFEAVIRAMLTENALVQLPDLTESEAPLKLAQVFYDLLAKDAKYSLGMGTRAREVCRENAGATTRTIDLLTHTLSGREDLKAPVSAADFQATAK